jgi:hypothetical protein
MYKDKRTYAHKKLEKRNWYNKFFVLLNIMYGIKIKMWTCDVCTNVS